MSEAAVEALAAAEAPAVAEAPADLLQGQETVNENGDRVAPDGTVIGPEGTPPAEAERPEWLPEKFKTPEELAKSYKELEKKLGQKAKPDVPDSYELKYGEEPAELSDEDVELFKKWGLSNEAAQELLDYAAEQVFPQMQQMAVEAEQTKLATGWNMQPDSVQFRERINKVGAWARDNLPQEAIDNLKSSAVGVQALWAMMSSRMASGAPQGQPATGKSKAELQAMVMDPRYNTDAGFREQVEQEFQRAYGK